MGIEQTLRILCILWRLHNAAHERYRKHPSIQALFRSVEYGMAIETVLEANPAAALVWYIQHENSNHSSGSSSSVGCGVFNSTTA